MIGGSGGDAVDVATVLRAALRKLSGSSAMTGDETLRQAEEAELARRVQGGDDIVSPLADADERDIEGALRPRRLAEFIGQARVREQLSLVLRAPCGAGGRRITCCWPGRPAWARPRSR